MTIESRPHPISAPARRHVVQRFAIFGAPGSFSEEAALSWAEREGLALVPSHYFDMSEVLSVVAARQADFGVLPVHNSVGGLVRASFEAMSSRCFRAVGQITMPIRHCLLVRSDRDPSIPVRCVVSHPQALIQCERYLALRLPEVERLPWTDTASAARALADGRLAPDCAVIASLRAAKIFSLKVQEQDIQDDSGNRTTFVVMGRT